MIVVDFVKRTVKNNTNAKGWMSWGSVKDNGRVIGDLAKGIGQTDPESNFSADSFSAAIKHYGLTEDDLSQRKRTHWVAAVFCAVLAVAALIWMFVLIFSKGMYLSGLVSLSLSALLGAYAFREHFFYFKIQQRRLDCTFLDWAKYFFSVKRK